MILKEYIPYEKSVIEYRAPTDESIRLWEEMKEKAYKSILDSIELKDNIFNFSAILYKSLHSYQIICKYRFTLNKYTIENEFPFEYIDLKDKSDLYKKLIETASQYIAIEITKSIKKDLFNIGI